MLEDVAGHGEARLVAVEYALEVPGLPQASSLPRVPAIARDLLPDPDEVGERRLGVAPVTSACAWSGIRQYAETAKPNRSEYAMSSVAASRPNSTSSNTLVRASVHVVTK
jgi:hypothetical protein